MNIRNVSFYHYDIPFVSPIKIKGKTLLSRQGFIVRFQSESGNEGLGEIAPLAFFNRESLEEVKKQITAVVPFFLNEPWPHHVEKLDGQFERYLGRLNLLPSVRFGIETAILNLIACQKKKSLSEILSVEPHKNVPISGLLQGSKEEVVNQAKDLLAQGYTSMKLKVGSDVEEDIAKVQAVNEIIYGKVLLHLDANQAWDIKKAVKFGETIGCAAMDYIEEPFKSCADIPDFFNKTLIPVALDETLLTTDIQDIKSIEGVDVLVVKPTALGGVEKAFHIIKEAQKVAIECTISSSYETDLGIFTLASMAACLPHHVEAGLDTLKFFETRLCVDSFANGRKISVDRLPITFSELNNSLIKPISAL